MPKFEFIPKLEAYNLINNSIILKSEAVKWSAFIVSSYIIGNLLDAVGSLILDKLYDRFYAKAMQIKEQLDEHRDISSLSSLRKFWMRWADAMRKKSRYLQDTKLQKYAKLYKQRDFDRENLRHQCVDERITNLFWWTSSVIRLRDSAASDEVDRLQADSKFFRSFAVFLMILFILLSCDYFLHPLLST